MIMQKALVFYILGLHVCIKLCTYIAILGSPGVIIVNSCRLRQQKHRKHIAKSFGPNPILALAIAFQMNSFFATIFNNVPSYCIL